MNYSNLLTANKRKVFNIVWFVLKYANAKNVKIYQMNSKVRICYFKSKKKYKNKEWKKIVQDVMLLVVNLKILESFVVYVILINAGNALKIPTKLKLDINGFVMIADQ